VNDAYYPPCPANITDHMVSCSGFVYEAPTGCTELVVVIANAYIPESYSYQYYTLHNLAFNSTINGQFVTVSGELFQGPNNSATGASYPGSYINLLAKVRHRVPRRYGRVFEGWYEIPRVCIHSLTSVRTFSALFSTWPLTRDAV